MTGKRLLSITARAVVIGAAAWLAVLLGISQMYVSRLIHPSCPSTPEKRAGYTSVTLKTEDGIPIKGWWTPPTRGVAVILMAGHGGGRDSMLPEMELLAKHEYGVLALDTRICAGKAATFGAREIAELRAGVQFAHSQKGVERVAVLGFSAGGVSAILGAAQMDEIDAVIAEGNYYNLWGEIANSGKPPLSLNGQVEYAVGALYWLETGVWPAAISPQEALRKISPRPVLLIHGEREAKNNHAQAQFDAAGAPKRLWIVPGAGHGQYRTAAPQEYEQTILDFLDGLP